MSEGRGDELALAGGEIIEGHHVVAIGQEAIDKGTADETGSAGDESMHEELSIVSHVQSEKGSGAGAARHPG